MSSRSAPATITAFKTAVFKVHNPSARKRAMLDHSLLHNHLAYTKALKSVLPLIKTLVDEELRARTADRDLPAPERARRARDRKCTREAFFRMRINNAISNLPICSAAKAARSIPGSIIGNVESHLELHGKQDAVGLPTVQSLHRDITPFENALQALVSSRTKEEEDEARDEMARADKAGQLRPLLFTGNRQSDGFLLLRRQEDDRYFIYLNLVPETSRFARLTDPEQREFLVARYKNL